MSLKNAKSNDLSKNGTPNITAENALLPAFGYLSGSMRVDSKATIRMAGGPWHPSRLLIS
jgi:hypothetical protein